MRVTLFSVILLGCSLVLGSLMAYFSCQYGSMTHRYSRWRKWRETPLSDSYRAWLEKKHLYQRLDGVLSTHVMRESNYLRAAVPTLCMVLLNGDSNDLYTSPEMPNMDSSLTAIQNTWGRRCAKTLYFSHERVLDEKTDIEVINLWETDLHSWAATVEMLRHIVSAGYLEKFNWFFNAQEDTFLVMENLLYYLSVQNATLPTYLGHAYTRWGISYNVGGPGYVLSQMALRRLHSHLAKGHCTMGLQGDADLGLGQCLAQVGVSVEDTRDTLGRARFLTYQPESLLIVNNLPWLDNMWIHSKYFSPGGPECCSDHAISFHYITPNMMYVLDYFIYHLRPYGVTSRLVRPLEGWEAEEDAATGSRENTQSHTDSHTPASGHYSQGGSHTLVAGGPGLADGEHIQHGHNQLVVDKSQVADNHRQHGHNQLAGNNNQVADDSNQVAGDHRYDHDQLTGDNNQVAVDSNQIAGDHRRGHNQPAANNNQVAGDHKQRGHNQLPGNNKQVDGNNNQVAGVSNQVAGDHRRHGHNQLPGNNEQVAWNSNQIAPNNNQVAGDHRHSDNQLAGNNNQVDTDYRKHGRNKKAGNSNQVVVDQRQRQSDIAGNHRNGKYNELAGDNNEVDADHGQTTGDHSQLDRDRGSINDGHRQVSSGHGHVYTSHTLRSGQHIQVVASHRVGSKGLVPEVKAKSKWARFIPRAQGWKRTGSDPRGNSGEKWEDKTRVPPGGRPGTLT